MDKKLFLIGSTATILVIAVIGFITVSTLPKPPEPVPIVVTEEVIEETSEPEPVVIEKTIGQSVEGRNINVVTFGTGANHLLFVGGIHGGYEWNSVLLAYQMINYLKANPEQVPDDVRISIIPDLNPDGVYEVVGKEGEFTLMDVPEPGTRVADARFNTNGVDLNRNFDCKWAPESTWRGKTVSAGSGPFSEPEAAALRDFVSKNKPDAVAFWHSKANNVYASECEDGVLPETLTLMSTYAQAAGYGEVPVFDAYPITGDAEGWLASIGIPAITVELGTHDTIEWDKNLAGTLATIKQYSSAK